MNKKTIKIAGWALGLSMAVAAIGAAVGASAESPIEAKADSISKASSISAGDKVVLVCEAVKKELASISTTSTKYGIGADYVSNPVGAMVFTVEVGNSAGTWSFKNGDNYLYWGSGNSLATDSEKSASTSWAVTFDGGNAVIKNSSDNARQVWWNVSSPRFACYTGKEDGTGYKYVQLYKIASDSPVTTVTLRNNGAKAEYVAGQTLSTDGIQAIATHEDSSNSDVTANCVVTVSPSIATMGLTSVTYSATYSLNNEIVIDDLTVTIAVKALAVSSIKESDEHPIQKDFTANDLFGLGTGKILVTNNDESTEEIGLDHDGVTYTIDSVDYTGKNYYITANDAEKDVVISYAGFSFAYKIGTVEAAPADEYGSYYQLVTSANQLSADDDIVITNGKNGSVHAMSTDQKTNNRGASGVTVSDNKISSISDETIQVITLEASSTNFKFKVGDDSYLYAASNSSNHLKTASSSTVGDNGVFSIAIDASTSVATVKAQGTNSHNWLRYNSTSDIFSCYGSGQQDIYLFKSVSNPKPANLTAVENYVTNNLHFDTVSYNDFTSGTACKAYYSTARDNYNNLTEDQRDLFMTSDVFLVARGRERLAAWAEANGDQFDDGDHYSLVKKTNLFNFAAKQDETTSTLPVVITIVASSVLLGVGTLALIHKRKEDR